MTLPAVSMHIRTLQNAGLVSQGRNGRVRPCRLDAAPMRELAVWLERYEVFWEQSLEKLDVYAKAVEREIADGTGSDD